MRQLGQWLRVVCWRGVALLALLLGLVGVVVPGLPTVVFLLLAAWAGGHGWPQLEARLLAHPRYGPPIRHWREQRALSRRAKRAAIGMMLISVLVLQFTTLDWQWRAGVPLLLLVVACWLWRRPEPREA